MTTVPIRIAAPLLCAWLALGMPALAAKAPPARAVQAAEARAAEKAAVVKELKRFQDVLWGRVAASMGALADAPTKGPGIFSDIREQNIAAAAACAKGLRDLTARGGWPGLRRGGREGALLALDLVVRFRDPAVQRWCLSELDKAHARNDLPLGKPLAAAVDKSLYEQGLPQRYGTFWEVGRDPAGFVPTAIADAANVDARRRSIGLCPLAEEYSAFNAIMLWQERAHASPRAALGRWLADHGFLRFVPWRERTSKLEALVAGEDFFGPTIGRSAPLEPQGLLDGKAAEAFQALRSLLSPAGAQWSEVAERSKAGGAVLVVDDREFVLWRPAERRDLPREAFRATVLARFAQAASSLLADAGSDERAWAVDSSQGWRILLATPGHLNAFACPPRPADPGTVMEVP